MKLPYDGPDENVNTVLEKLAEAHKDTERLDWIESLFDAYMRKVVGWKIWTYAGHVQLQTYPKCGDKTVVDTCRQAIDKARGKE